LSANRSPGHRWDLINVCQGNRSAWGRTTQRPRWESVRMERISCQIRKLRFVTDRTGRLWKWSIRIVFHSYSLHLIRSNLLI
jgi:hypothetical protein